jgi:hypothetical protein
VKGARFRASSRDNPNRETPELADIHEASRSGPDRLRSDCTPGVALPWPRGSPDHVRPAACGDQFPSASTQPVRSGDVLRGARPEHDARKRDSDLAEDLD